MGFNMNNNGGYPPNNSTCGRNFSPRGGRQNCPNQDSDFMPQTCPFPSVSYARYSISSLGLTSQQLLPLTLAYSGAQDFNLTSGTTVTLPACYVYQISYNVQVTLPTTGFVQIVPLVNNSMNTNLSAYDTVTNTQISNMVSLNGSFIIPAEQATTLAFELLTNVATTGTVTGSVSIVAIGKIPPQYIC